MKIKEVEKKLQMNSQTIRYYDKLGFPNPKRDENGYRNYTMDDIKTLKKIRFLRELDIPLEMIERILLNQDEFQNILEQHLQTLQLQVENLAEIQQKCLKLTQKNIPLLDAVVDGEFYAYNDYDKDIKTLFQKITEFMQPYSVITIGRKTTPYQLVKEMFGYFIIVGFIFLAMLSVLGRHLFTNGIGWIIWLTGTFIFWILFMLINFHEKYYEFQDADFYIFDSHKMKLKSIMAILKQTTHQLAKHYFYKDIDNVKIIIEKKVGGIGFGPMNYYNVIYQFNMLDGQHFTVNSSLYEKDDQDRKSVYEILEYHHVHIIDDRNFKAALMQNKLSLYEYLEKNM